MNLFIGGNFFNTFGNKIDILQLIRQITEEDDTIQSECLDVIEREHGDEYADLEGADDKYATIQDDVLYVDGATAVLIFNDLFDNDWDEVVARIGQQIDNYQGGVLKLQSNGFPEEVEELASGQDGKGTGQQETQLEIPVSQGFTTPSRPALPAAELFKDTPSWMESDSVQEAAVATGIRSNLPQLKFAGNPIRVLQDEENGEILFNLKDLYFAAYCLDYEDAYIAQVILRNRLALDAFQHDVRFENQTIYAGVSTIAILHGELTHAVEFAPVVSEIVGIYEDCLAEENAKRTAVEIDLFGNLK